MTKKKQKVGKTMPPDPARKAGQASRISGMDDRSMVDWVKNNPVASGFFSVLGLLLILDFAVHKHGAVTVGNIPEFYAVFGFFAAVLLVFAAKGLKALFDLKRK